jgi:XisI protein
MDTRLKYQNIIKSVLQNHADYRAALPDDYTSHVLFDDERGQYLILDMGWSGDQYLHSTPIHLSLIGEKIWIQCDDTEEGVATDLLQAGVPKEDIVLGFRHPKVRQYTGFAVIP